MEEKCEEITNIDLKAELAGFIQWWLGYESERKRGEKTCGLRNCRDGGSIA